MIAAARAQRACPQCRIQVLSAIENSFTFGRRELSRQPKFQFSRGNRARLISTTRSRFQEPTSDANPSSGIQGAPQVDDIETTVRQAKKTFGNTLPKNYLTPEEHTLYVRLYGEPLRETEPDDVGIPVPEPMVRQDPEDPSRKILLREMEDGSVQEIPYYVDVEDPADPEAQDSQEDTQSAADLTVNHDDLPSEAGLQYIGAVAKNEREYNALLKLQRDFENSSLRPDEEEDGEYEEPLEEEPLEEQDEEEDENETGMVLQRVAREESDRVHDHTKAGQWRTNPSTVHLPKRDFVEPTTEILQRTSTTHIKAAAEEMFGGPGLPHSVATPSNKKNSPQQGPAIGPGLPKMSEIDADAYLATNLPGMYATTMSILVEIRKRLGSGWVERMIESGEGPRVLDVGAGGAGAAAWDQILQAEWDLARDSGRKRGSEPPGKKTVVVGSENLRTRVSQFLHNTSFLPRLPDYLHSGDHPDKLDGGESSLPRKQFDIIIASHQLMPIKEDYRRKALLDNLWEMLSPDGGIIIFVEKGHPRGFEAVADVRSRLLNEFIVSPTSEPPLPSLDGLPRREREEGSIIAPCTTRKECPMYLNPGLTPGRKDFCHFSQRYIRPPYMQRVLGAKHQNHEDINFSFVAVQRGVTSHLERPTNAQEEKDLTEKAFEGYEKSTEAPNPLALPRNVMAPLKRRGHVTMDLCTPAGKIERWTVPKSFSKQAYHDARKAQWGDLWALGAKTRVERPVRLGRGGPAPNDGGKRSQAAWAGGKKTKTINVYADGGGIFKTSGNNNKGAPEDKSDIPKSKRKGKSPRTLRHGKHMKDTGSLMDNLRDIRSRAARGGDDE